MSHDFQCEAIAKFLIPDHPQQDNYLDPDEYEEKEKEWEEKWVSWYDLPSPSPPTSGHLQPHLPPLCSNSEAYLLSCSTSEGYWVRNSVVGYPVGVSV